MAIKEFKRKAIHYKLEIWVGKVSLIVLNLIFLIGTWLTVGDWLNNKPVMKLWFIFPLFLIVFLYALVFSKKTSDHLLYVALNEDEKMLTLHYEDGRSETIDLPGCQVREHGQVRIIDKNGKVYTIYRYIEKSDLLLRKLLKIVKS